MGFVVAHCPFCGLALLTAPVAEAARPAAPAAAAVAAAAPPPPAKSLPVEPTPAAPPAPAAGAASPWLTKAAPPAPAAGAASPWQIKAAPPAAPPAPPPPAKPRKPARAPRQPPPPRTRRKPGGWRWVVALLAVVAVLQARSRGHDAAPASLTVYVSPEAAGSITVDGAPSGRPGEALPVSAGTHTIGFLSAEWLAASRQVTLDAGQSASTGLRLQHKGRRPAPLPERLVRPPARVGGPAPLPSVTAFAWTAIGDAVSTSKLCGVETSINGGRLLLYGGSEKPTTLRLLLHKDLWHIPGLTVPVIIAFTGGPTFTVYALGSGSDIAADIPWTDVRDFIHHFTADQDATLTLQNGRELPWTLDLRGTSPTIDAMAKCLAAAELWLPMPFTQQGAP